jgi:hypothetical protein
MRNLVMFLTLLVASTAANAEWHKAVTDHFVIYAEGDEKSLRDYAEKLERFDSGARRLRSLPEAAVPGANRVTVYALPAKEFAKIVPNRQVAGFYIPRTSGSKIFLPGYGGSMNPEHVLLHEYTHHLYAVSWANIAVPGWLSEGLAEFHATAEVRKDGSMVIGREPSSREWALRDLTVDEIRRMLTTQTAETGASIYYSGGWLLTHFLTFDDERQAQLGEYLIAVNSGKSLEEAATGAFGDMFKLERDLKRYRRGTGLRAVVIPGQDLKVGQIEVHALTPGEAATIQVAIRSQRGVTEQEAPDLYAEAKMAAAAYPDDAAAQRVLAEAAYDADDHTAAKVAAERAIAADPSMGSAYAYKAMAIRAAAGEDDTPAGEIRDVIEAGLKADPNSAQLLELYYRSFRDSGEAPTELAKRRLYQAFRIAPQSDSLRMMTAHQLLADRNPAEARALLRPLGFSIHRSKTADVARAIITEIDAGNVDAALRATQNQAEDGADAGPGEDGGDAA